MNSGCNISRVIPDEPTNQVAELTACLAALEMIIEIKDGGWDTDELDHPISLVVIKADSDYVVKGMTEWILTWRSNGYRTYNGRPVKNAKYFRRVDHAVDHLESLGVNVRFWHVPRNRDKEADRLANEAFNGSGMY
ncbi:hypothetical protein MMC34_000773 [Xylographa carneopallida]|nr:hypothetical protein [Xylographa carneopallida]